MLFWDGFGPALLDAVVYSFVGHMSVSRCISVPLCRGIFSGAPQSCVSGWEGTSPNEFSSVFLNCVPNIMSNEFSSVSPTSCSSRRSHVDLLILLHRFGLFPPFDDYIFFLNLTKHVPRLLLAVAADGVQKEGGCGAGALPGAFGWLGAGAALGHTRSATTSTGAFSHTPTTCPATAARIAARGEAAARRAPQPTTAPAGPYDAAQFCAALTAGRYASLAMLISGRRMRRGV